MYLIDYILTMLERTSRRTKPLDMIPHGHLGTIEIILNRAIVAIGRALSPVHLRGHWKWKNYNIKEDLKHLRISQLYQKKYIEYLNHSRKLKEKYRVFSLGSE